MTGGGARYDDLMTFLGSYEITEEVTGLEFLKQNVDQVQVHIETSDPYDLLACLASQGYQVITIRNIVDHSVLPLTEKKKRCTKNKK